MIIKAKLLAVELGSYVKNGDQKQIADVVLMSGSDVLQCKMFDADVQAGKAALYEKLTGKDLILEVRAEVYRGELTYRLGNKDPRVSGQTAPAAKVA